MRARLHERRGALAVVVIVVAAVLAIFCVATGEPGAALFAGLLAVPPALFLLDRARAGSDERR